MILDKIKSALNKKLVKNSTKEMIMNKIRY